MASFFEYLSRYVLKYFWAIWGLIPIIIVIYGLLSFYKHGFNNFAIFSESDKHKINKNNLLISGSFLAFLGLYIFLIIYKEDFAFYDEYQYLISTLKGINYGTPIWLSQGRFWPLGHQEFNIIRFVNQSAIGYHLFPIMQLLIVVAALFIFLIDFPVWFIILNITIIISTPSFVMSFFALVIPERNIIFWLVILLICFKYFVKTRNKLYFCVALIAAHFALYYKEPVFLLIGGFAGMRLILHGFFERSLLQRRGYQQFFRTHCLELGLLILTGFFLLLYTSVFLPYINFEYARLRSMDIFSVIVSYLSFDPLLDIFLVAIIARSLYLIYSRQLPNSFWDSLAIGAFLYFLSYIKIQLFHYYYMAPVDLIAILYLGQLVYPKLKEKKVIVSTITALVTFLIASRNAVSSFEHIAARKNLIDGKIQLTQFIKQYAQTASNRNVTLFFPYSTEFNIMEFSAFLEYKGLKLAKHYPSKPTDKIIFTVKSPAQFPKENRCVDYVDSIKCFHAKYPQSGDLIVVFTNDDITTEQLTKIKQESILLFHYKPLIPFPKKILPLFLFNEHSDIWRHIYVFQKP